VLPEPLRARAVHVVSEAARARFGAELLARGCLKRFGELLYESHVSARRLFAVGSPEADAIVAAARRARAYGARLSGAEVIVLLGAGGAAGGRRAVTAAIARGARRTGGGAFALEPLAPCGGVRVEPIPRQPHSRAVRSRSTRSQAAVPSA
jgi:galactokinase